MYKVLLQHRDKRQEDTTKTGDEIIDIRQFAGAQKGKKNIGLGEIVWREMEPFFRFLSLFFFWEGLLYDHRQRKTREERPSKDPNLGLLHCPYA